MTKAKYIGKYKSEKGIDLIYQYKGHEYIVTDYGWSGYSESLKEQHEFNQRRIDMILDIREKESDRKEKEIDKSEFNLEEVFEILGWD